LTAVDPSNSNNEVGGGAETGKRGTRAERTPHQRPNPHVSSSKDSNPRLRSRDWDRGPTTKDRSTN